MADLINSILGRWQSRLARQRRAYLESIASLAPTCQISSEGAIENILGDPGCITIGDHSFLRGRLLTYGHAGRIEIGRWCYLGVRSEIWSMDLIRIGDHVLIAHDVNIHDGTGHPLDAMQRREHFKKIMTGGHPRTSREMPGVTSAPIVIEEDVSIGFGTIIFQGVHIGARSVIAPGSVITRDVPADTMYMSAVKPILLPISLLTMMRNRGN